MTTGVGGPVMNPKPLSFMSAIREGVRKSLQSYADATQKMRLMGWLRVERCWGEALSTVRVARMTPLSH